MQLFKKLLTFAGFALIPFQANAQIVNGDFTSGPSSWNWSQSSSFSSSGVCAPLQAFVPVQNIDTPFLQLNQNYGRSAKVTFATATSATRAVFCRKIEQEVDIAIGSRVLLDLWSNNGRNAAFPKKYVGNITLTLQDTASSLVRSYPVLTVNGVGCDEVTGSLCSDYLPSVTDIDSAFWGKRVKLSITTEARKDTFDSPATTYVDNIRLEKLPVSGLMPKTGAWFNPYRSGHGLHLSKATDGRYVLMWYSYLSSGKPIWYISDTVAVINGVFVSKIYKSTWNYSTQTNTRVPIGDIKLEMHNNNFSTFSWDLYSVNGDNVGFDGGEPMGHLFGGESYTGLWYEPALSGYGYSIDYRNNSGGIDTSATVFYYINGEPVWARGDKEGAPILNNTIPLTAYVGVGLCPECNGQTVIKTPSAVGEAGLSFDINKSWVYLQDSTGTAVWQRGLPAQPVDTVRLTYP